MLLGVSAEFSQRLNLTGTYNCTTSVKKKTQFFFLKCCFYPVSETAVSIQTNQSQWLFMYTDHMCAEVKLYWK